jgi:hypothetical protein
LPPPCSPGPPLRRTAGAAQFNEAVKSDPQARQALDKVEKSLNDAGHRSGQLLEKTRP